MIEADSENNSEEFDHGESESSREIEDEMFVVRGTAI